MKVKPGYKQTEVGVIPTEWQVKALGSVFVLKNGFAFPSENFSSLGPIVLTPGNFCLEGGLYFEQRNTKRYSGSYSSEFTFRRGDLLIVMTDLTPNCNLLGKPAFVETDEFVLHNQRIGKVLLKDKCVYVPFLYYFLLSRAYLSHVKEQAYGSTVRHTSNKSIYSAQLGWPPPAEQRAIAAALSDVDVLLQGLERLIAKKRNLKQAAMEQLLTGQTRLPGFIGEWKVKKLRDCLLSRPDYGINAAAVPYSDKLPTYMRITDISEQGRFRPDPRVSVNAIDADQYFLRKGDVVFARTGASVGKSYLYSPQDGELVFAGFLIRVRPNPEILSSAYLAAYAMTKRYQNWVQLMSMRSGQPGINGNEYSRLPVFLPPPTEQIEITAVLSDMDAELSVLESRRDKTQALKKGMMQELLTGRTRLV